jgi:hypothetical protein
MTKLRFVIAGLFASLLPSFGAAADWDRVLDGANAEFERGVQARNDEAAARQHFYQAAIAYGQLTGQGLFGFGQTPGLRRMEGTSWLLAGDVPRAIHFYHEGLRLNPDDEQLLRALEYARSRVLFASPEERAALTPPREEFRGVRLLLRRWGIWLIAVTNVLAWAALARWVATRRPLMMASFALLFILTVVIVVVSMVDHQRRHDTESTQIEVLFRAEVLRRGDGRAFLPRREAPLPAGTEVRKIEMRGEWVQVELADGTAGWLPAASLTVPPR